MTTEDDSELASVQLLRIDDPRVLKIPDVESGEQMVSLLDLPRLVLPSTVTPQIPNIEDSRTPYARNGVKERLGIAIQALPEQYLMVLIEAQRTVDYQNQIFQQILQELRLSNPKMAADELDILTRSMVSDPSLFSPHVTGGAVDVALADQKTMRYVDMGNFFNHDASAATDYQGLSETQAKNRTLLKGLMQKAGLVNYPREWWHWSYGDKLWAYLNQKPNAIYGVVK